MNQEFKDKIAKAMGISPEEQRTLDIGNEHRYDCTCLTCLQW